jgi:hypothetical protein
MVGGEWAGWLRLSDDNRGDYPRYHGLLIALPAPLGRMVVLPDLEVDIALEDGSVVNLREKGRFLDFTLNMGLPSWRYETRWRRDRELHCGAPTPEHPALHLFARWEMAGASACGSDP